MSDNKIVIQELKDQVLDFVSKRDWTQYHSPKNLAMSISIEAAELMEIFQWLSLTESIDLKDDEAKYTHIKEELADILIYCISFANTMGIDISEAIKDKSKKNAIKYPVNKNK